MKLSRKIEKAIAGYLPSRLAIADLKIYEGHERADEIEFPNLIIYAEGAAQFADMPPSTGVRVVRIRAKFTVDSEASQRGPLDQWQEQLEAAMFDVGTLQARLNQPVSGPDTRSVRGIHIHDVEPGEEPSDVNETDWVEDSIFDVVCQSVL